MKYNSHVQKPAYFNIQTKKWYYAWKILYEGQPKRIKMSKKVI